MHICGWRFLRSFKEKLRAVGLEGKIFYPQYRHMIDVISKEDFNLASVVMLLTFANQKILYTGDLPYAGWEEIDEKEDLKSDVFKVPHHGGWISDSSGKDMKAILNRVNPNFALVSVGSDNTHKHPLREVISAIVTHPSAPYLLCTQMTGQCSGNRFQLKEKIDAFYRSKSRKKKILRFYAWGKKKAPAVPGPSGWVLIKIRTSGCFLLYNIMPWCWKQFLTMTVYFAVPGCEYILIILFPGERGSHVEPRRITFLFIFSHQGTRRYTKKKDG